MLNLKIISIPFFTISSSFLSTGYPYLESTLLLDQNKFSIIQKKTVKKFFTRLFFVTSNRYKFQITDKRSLLILNVQNIVFNIVQICIFEILLNVLNRAYHVSNSSSNLPSFFCPIALGIFPLLSSYLRGIACLVHR